jgi:hypothetical protein
MMEATLISDCDFQAAYLTDGLKFAARDPSSQVKLTILNKQPCIELMADVPRICYANIANEDGSPVDIDQHIEIIHSDTTSPRDRANAFYTRQTVRRLGWCRISRHVFENAQCDILLRLSFV